MCFLAFLTKIWDPENFTFALENGQTTEAREKVFFLNVAWDVANNRYFNRFFRIKTSCLRKLEHPTGPPGLNHQGTSHKLLPGDLENRKYATDEE